MHGLISRGETPARSIPSDPTRKVGYKNPPEAYAVDRDGSAATRDSRKVPFQNQLEHRMKSSLKEALSAFDTFEAAVQEAKLDPRFKGALYIAAISAPAVVIEAIVRKASTESGVLMDWSYEGGRGFVRALPGEMNWRSSAQRAIEAALPVYQVILD